MAAAVTEHPFWITSRAAGTVALRLSSLAVCVGLLSGGKLVRGRPDLRHLHEALSLATIVALVVHAVALLGDGHLSPGVADISIPFVGGYERGWTTLGIVAGWATVVLVPLVARHAGAGTGARTTTAPPGSAAGRPRHAAPARPSARSGGTAPAAASASRR